MKQTVYSTRSYASLLCFIMTISNVILSLSAQAAEEETKKSSRSIERPFLTRDLHIFGIRTPITPMTLIIFGISFLILYSNLTKQSSAVASHILLDDSSDETRAKLEKMKKEIGNDKAKFAKYAAEHSKCPSGKGNGGSLGKFNIGNMVPPFDKAVFSPKNEVGVVIGPVQTQFGWHLILVHERDEQRQLIVE